MITCRQSNQIRTCLCREKVTNQRSGRPIGGWGAVQNLPRMSWRRVANNGINNGSFIGNAANVSTRAADWPNPKTAPPWSVAKLSAHVSAAPLTCASGCWQMIGTFGSETSGTHGASASSYPNPPKGPPTPKSTFLLRDPSNIQRGSTR